MAIEPIAGHGRRRDERVIYLSPGSEMYVSVTVRNFCPFCQHDFAEETTRDGTMFTCIGGCGQRFWEDA